VRSRWSSAHLRALHCPRDRQLGFHHPCVREPRLAVRPIKLEHRSLDFHPNSSRRPPSPRSWSDTWSPSSFRSRGGARHGRPDSWRVDPSKLRCWVWSSSIFAGASTAISLSSGRGRWSLPASSHGAVSQVSISSRSVSSRCGFPRARTMRSAALRLVGRIRLCKAGDRHHASVVDSKPPLPMSTLGVADVGRCAIRLHLQELIEIDRLA
jgi:hypothetical protein